MSRNPSKISFFDTLVENNYIVEIVCDVGVHLYGTADLIKAFPLAHHIFFEPVKEFSAEIRKLYADISHDFYQYGLGKEIGNFQLNLNRSDSDNVTHSQFNILNNELIVSDSDSNYSVDVMTLEWLVEKHIEIKSLNTLLKLDVDGFELEILKGAGASIQYFDLIIIEMPMKYYFDRLNFLVSAGFILVDILDPTYYHRHLSQVDMIFASPFFIEKNPKFCPWSYYEFEWEDYFHWTPS